MDSGISGGLLDRPAMKRLMEYIDAHPNEKYVIIFDDLKRFARDVAVHMGLSHELVVKRKCRLECLNFNFEDSPIGRAMETIIAATAQLEREQNAEQVKNKMRARAEQGCWPLCQPTGYQFIKTVEHGKLLHPKRPQADIIKEALEGFASNRFVSPVDVKDFLEDKAGQLGLKKIHFSFVRRILEDILYTGYIEYPRWQITRRKGHHEGLITLRDYERIQAKLRKPVSKARETDSPTFPLRRKISCSLCQKPFTGSKNKGKRNYYANYTCNNARCSAKPKNISPDVLHEAYTKLLDGIAPGKGILKLAEAISMDVWKREVAAISDNASGVKKQASGKRKEVEAYVALIPKVKSDLVRAKYEAKIEELELEILSLESKLPQVDEGVGFKEALNEVLDFVGTPAKYWNTADLAGKLMVHRLVFTENPYFDSQNGFGTPQISLPFEVKALIDGSKNHLVEMGGVEPPCRNKSMDRLRS